MSVEAKIRELMEGKKPAAQTEQLDEVATFTADSVKKDTSVPVANPGDAESQPQGSSQKADYEERDEDEENQGAVASKSTPAAPRPQGSGPGGTPDYKTVGDPASVVNMPSSKGNVPMESVDIKTELKAILGEDASEEFTTKATSLFEAAVIARVNIEVEKLSEQLQEQTATAISEAKEQLIEKVDSYLSYVVEQWLEDNKLAVDTGLRTEIAEDFITGLKTLFVEHNISIPEEKYDALAEAQKQADEIKGKLDEAVTDNITLKAQVIELKKQKIFEAQAKDLAATEVEKLQKLVEGIEFDSEELYAEKVSLIKETHFHKGKKPSGDQLTEDLTGQAPVMQDDVMSKYAQAISRAAKFK